MLGEDGVLRILRLLGGVEPHKLIERLLAEIAERYPLNLTEDDVTVLLVMRVNGRAAHTRSARSWERCAGSPGRMIRALRPGTERPPFPDMNMANLGGAIIPALGRRWRAQSRD